MFKAYVKLKLGYLSKEVRREFGVPGSFWGADKDKNVIYRAKVIEVEVLR